MSNMCRECGVSNLRWVRVVFKEVKEASGVSYVVLIVARLARVQLGQRFLGVFPVDFLALLSTYQCVAPQRFSLFY